VLVAACAPAFKPIEAAAINIKSARCLWGMLKT
jgi:hypothetical protein